ncbi:MAG: hypothetical protein V1933_07430, partial [Candidatus Omnitrophota bacterium]
MEESKRIIIFESDAERAKTIESWLKELNLDFVIDRDLKNLEAILPKEKIACLLLNLHLGTDSSLYADPTLQGALALVHVLKKSLLTQDITAILVTSQKAVDLIVSAINAGVDDILVGEENKDQFLKSIRELLKRMRPAIEKKKLIDLNLINSLMQLFSNASREEFFLLVSTILNQLLLAKLKPVIGDPVLISMMALLQNRAKKYFLTQKSQFSYVVLFSISFFCLLFTFSPASHCFRQSN